MERRLKKEPTPSTLSCILTRGCARQVLCVETSPEPRVLELLRREESQAREEYQYGK